MTVKFTKDAQLALCDHVLRTRCTFKTEHKVIERDGASAALDDRLTPRRLTLQQAPTQPKRC